MESLARSVEAKYSVNQRQLATISAYSLFTKFSNMPVDNFLKSNTLYLHSV